MAGYKTHTDCIEDNADERDRMATILVYLQDVEDGGETKFPGKLRACGIIFWKRIYWEIGMIFFIYRQQLIIVKQSVLGQCDS